MFITEVLRLTLEVLTVLTGVASNILVVIVIRHLGKKKDQGLLFAKFSHSRHWYAANSLSTCHYQNGNALELVIWRVYLPLPLPCCGNFLRRICVVHCSYRN